MKPAARGPEPIPPRRPRRPEQQPVILNVVDPAALTPGCKVLVSMQGHIDAETAERYQGLLAERFPDVEFTILANARVAAIYPPTKPGAGR